MFKNHSPTKIGDHPYDQLSTFNAQTYETSTGVVTVIDSVVIATDLISGKTYGYFGYDCDSPEQRNLHEHFEKISGNTIYTTDAYDDIIVKAESILNGVAYDTNVILNLDLDEDTSNYLQKRALETGKTIDEIVEEAITALMTELKEKENSNVE